MGERLEGAGKKPVNPAKVFLSQYRGLCMRYADIENQIAQAEARATDTAAHISAAKVQSGRISDAVGDAAAQAVDVYGLLLDTEAKITLQLSRILAAIEAVPEEMQKAILTKRYIAGKSWKEVCSEVGYERTRVNELHGWGLLAVNRWLEETGAGGKADT